MSTLFYLLSVLNFGLIILGVWITIKVINKPSSPLGGWESIIISILLLGSIFIVFSSGLEADQSHKHLEYSKVVESKAKLHRIINNPYEFYPMTEVAGKTAGGIFVVLGYLGYSYTKEKRRYKHAQAMSDHRFIKHRV